MRVPTAIEHRGHTEFRREDCECGLRPRFRFEAAANTPREAHKIFSVELCVISVFSVLREKPRKAMALPSLLGTMWQAVVHELQKIFAAHGAMPIVQDP